MSGSEIHCTHSAIHMLSKTLQMAEAFRCLVMFVRPGIALHGACFSQLSERRNSESWVFARISTDELHVYFVRRAAASTAEI